ncbi:MAG: GNAT family N-acetyltransferase [Chloroflexota bacterium]
MDHRITRFNHPDQDWLPAVLSLRAEFGDTDSPEPFINFVAPRLEDETMLLVLAWIDETPVGYGLAFDVAEHPYMPEWTRAGYITQFLVSQKFRQQGIGKSLMNYINNWFASRDIKKVLLNVNLDNEAGNLFWKSQGFVPYATRMRRSHT